MFFYHYRNSLLDFFIISFHLQECLLLPTCPELSKLNTSRHRRHHRAGNLFRGFLLFLLSKMKGGQTTMPTKAEMYAQMAEKVAVQLTGSWQEWTGFLTTAARLYKYPFHEQLMIYAQRPDATACAEYDLWNDRMAGMCGAVPRVSPGGRFRRPAPAALCVRYFRHRHAGKFPHTLAVAAGGTAHWACVGHAGTQLRCEQQRPGPATG